MTKIFTPPGQKLKSLDPKNYHDYRVVVFGSRGYKDRQTFHRTICDFLEGLEEGAQVLFICGATIHPDGSTTPSGPDSYIVEWCNKFKYPCLTVPAEWDKYKNKLTRNGKNPAGMIRNEVMAKMSTHGIGFYDGQSPGTTHMLDICGTDKLNVKLIVKVTNNQVRDELIRKTQQPGRYSRSKASIFEGMDDELEDCQEDLHRHPLSDGHDLGVIVSDIPD